MGCIYLVTNTINGKHYVGKTSGEMNRRKAMHEKDAKNESRLPFHRAIRKYGLDAFEWEEVYSDVADEDLDRLEIECIAWYGTRIPKGYNLTSGGEGGDTFSFRDSESKARTIAKVKAFLTGRPKSKEHKINLSLACKGRVVSPERRKHQSLVTTGQKRTPEQRANISNGLKGKVKSSTHRENIRKAALKQFESESARFEAGKAMRGKKHKPDAIKKMKESAAKLRATPGYAASRSKISIKTWLKRKRNQPRGIHGQYIGGSSNSTP